MGKLIFATILIIVAIAAWRITQRVALSLAATPRDVGTSRIVGRVGRIFSVLVGCVALLIVFLSIFVVVPPGHAGIMVLFGQVQDRTLAEGLSIVPPWYDIVKMSLQVQKKTAKFDAASKDLQAVHVDMVLNFRLLPDRAASVYRTVGLEYTDTIVIPAEQEVLKAHTASYNASEILHKRPKLKTEIQQDLSTWLLKYGVFLSEASLANIRFDPAYEKAIEAKQIEEQKAEQKLYELTQAQRQAEIVAANAKGVADSVREQAKGEADALRTKGQAQAEYNSKVSASLTPALVQIQWIEQWGKGGARVPDVYSHGAGGEGFLFQLPRSPQGKKTE